MFGPSGFRSFRRVDAMFRSQGRLKLFNPMWRLLPDPITGEGHREPNTPYGTFLGDIWHSLIDGVLVSAEWLTNQGYVMHDNRIRILTDDLWHHVGKGGAHHVRPANVPEKQAKELAITDHLPIAVNLEIKRGTK
jgi:hypothetical protein